MRLEHIITKEDVGKNVIKKQCPTCGTKQPLYIQGVMGRILSCDVGKRIYRYNSGVLGVESQEQLEIRTN